MRHLHFVVEYPPVHYNATDYSACLPRTTTTNMSLDPDASEICEELSFAINENINRAFKTLSFQHSVLCLLNFGLACVDPGQLISTAINISCASYMTRALIP